MEFGDYEEDLPTAVGISFSIQALGCSDCHPREYPPSSQRQTHLHATCTAGRTGRALKLVRGDAAFLIMSLHPPPFPSNLREKQLSEKIWKWARSVLDETSSRVVPVLLLDATGHISQTTWSGQIGKYSKKHIQRPVLGRTCAGPPHASGEPEGATFFEPFTNTQVDFACLPAAVPVHRCCALHHDGDGLQLAAAPWSRDHRSIQCVFQHQLTCGIHEQRQDHQWYKNKLTQGALFAQDRTTCLTRVEEACRHDEEWTHLTITSFWANLSQVLVDAGADLYAREI